jgi:hypothetical protein
MRGLTNLQQAVADVIKKVNDRSGAATAPAQLAAIKSSREYAFLGENFDDFLSYGLGQSVHLIKGTASAVFGAVHLDLRALYGVYVGFVIFFFLVFVFRSTSSSIQLEAEKVGGVGCGGA